MALIYQKKHTTKNVKSIAPDHATGKQQCMGQRLSPEFKCRLGKFCGSDSVSTTGLNSHCVMWTNGSTQCQNWFQQQHGNHLDIYFHDLGRGLCKASTELCKCILKTTAHFSHGLQWSWCQPGTNPWLLAVRQGMVLPCSQRISLFLAIAVRY